jgi:diguanylate cyclase (GGDEF)-like protein
MHHLSAALIRNESDSVLFDRLKIARKICLGVVALIAAANLCLGLINGAGSAGSADWHRMAADTALAALLCSLSLWLVEERESPRLEATGRVLGLVVAFGAVLAVAAGLYPIRAEIETAASAGAGSLSETLSPPIAGAFALLALSSALLGSQRRVTIRAGEIAIFLLGLLVLILVSGYFYGALRIFGLPAEASATPQTLVCLVLLTAVVLLRRAESGIFSIFIGRGLGSKIARALLPILVFLPFAREAGRARLFRSGLIPPHYATAILASIATMVSIGLLLYLAWRIRKMEVEIHDLSLRDSLTGLYNQRGFFLLGEQALLLARRGPHPFSVLYIDLDDLKKINDAFGHEAGSQSLMETAEVLRATFRETDVLGRIGGDEFAVAGQFSPAGISIAADRLRSASAAKSAEPGHKFALSFSIGYVTADERGHGSLKELLAGADSAMYTEKRRRKA